MTIEVLANNILEQINTVIAKEVTADYTVDHKDKELKSLYSIMPITNMLKEGVVPVSDLPTYQELVVQPFCSVTLSETFFSDRLNSYTKIPFNNILVDRAGDFDATNERIVVQKTGYYFISINVEIHTSSVFDTSNFVYPCNVYKNGNLISGDDTYFTTTKYGHFSSSVGVYLEAGDIIEFKTHDAGNYVVFSGGDTNTRLTFFRVGS